MRLFGGRKKEEPREAKPLESVLPTLSVDRSFNVQDVERARSSLRISGTEKEILSETLTRLYEASTDGRLTPTERDQLVSKYQRQLSSVTSTFEHSERLLSLHELEETRAELVNMFQDKFKELNVKIEDVRKRVNVKPSHVMAVKLPPLTPPTTLTSPAREKPQESKPPTTEKTAPPTATPTTPAAPKKTKADDTLDKLRKDLQKELEKLEQIEMEA
jgi:hypothetical protein